MRTAPAFLSAWMIAVDGALVDVSRFMLLDTFLLFFGFSAIWAHQKWLRQGRVSTILLTGILCALSFSIKWTGLTFLLLIGLRQFSYLMACRGSLGFSSRGVLLIFSLLLMPCVFYVMQFYLHFQLLPKSGTGDAFMSPAFQSTLLGNDFSLTSDYVRPGFFEKFIEINRAMYSASANMTSSHPYGSSWYSWPLMLKPIYLWFGEFDKRIYMLGNPLIWWGSLAFTLAAIQVVVILRSTRWAPGVGFLLTGWALNWFPFSEIRRVMFIYHYLPSLVFSILLVGSFLNALKSPILPVLFFAFLALCLSVYYSLVTYGLSPCWSILWMPSWT